MGLFDNLFGGRSNFKGAIRNLENAYKGVREYSDVEYGKIIDQFLQERTNNADVYSRAYNEAVSQYSSLMAQSREAFKASSEEAFNMLNRGRQNTLALMQQQADAATGRAQISGLVTGLANTTFGQNYVNAVAAQGALQMGAVEEQYAQTLASARMSQANALAQMEQGAAQSLFAAGLGSAQYQSGQYQQYTTAAQAARGARLASNLGFRTRPIEARFAADTQLAMMDMQSGNALGGALLGSALGTLGQNIGGSFGGALGNFGNVFGGGGGQG